MYYFSNNQVSRPRHSLAYANTDIIAHHASWIVPFEKNLRFIDRESQLTKLEENIFAGDHTTKVVITGLGGGRKDLVGAYTRLPNQR
jgi:hypothetical protein